MAAVRLLLSHGMSIDDGSITALTAACFAGHLHMVKHLIQLGANITHARPNSARIVRKPLSSQQQSEVIWT
jgi:ankyrin repeat protein